MKSHSTDDLVRSMARVHDENLAGFAGRPAARDLAEDIMTLTPPKEFHAETAAQAGDGGRAEGPERTPRRFQLPGLGVRLAVVGAMAAIAVGGVVLRADLPAGEQAPESSGAAPQSISLGSAAKAAHVLDRAAKAAETRSLDAPGPRQWVYTKMKLTSSAKPAGLVSGGPYKTEAWELWRRGDGKQFAAYKNGKPQTGHETVSSSVAAKYEPLPSDPKALLRKVGGSKGHSFMAYQTLVTLLRDTVHSAETEAAIFRAIKLIPGVTPVEGRVDAAGRPAIGLGLTVDGWLHEEVLLDPQTYAYLGERAITIKSRTFESAGEPAFTVKAGTLQRLMVRDAIEVVDKPGQRP
ncbi:CU044_5270 family protein [Actinomadura sp. 6K520]|uniref:CU044_5270 family protein n=1 Tax=Actinomadura sp. 6K520 TaxID=2530364 RepID=UPI001043C84C|nr:CU044_5270 family protein [Actinomadura sp. 6K520]TDE32421.1 hypothetical protein E1289_15575 [Actinomadura sp. 6K520]